MKKYFSLFILTVVFLLFTVSVSAAPMRVAYIINGALGDQSFYDSGQRGIDQIAEEYDVKTTTIECNFDTAKYQQSLQSAVQWNADVVFIISYGFEDLLKQYADMYPDKIFVNIDTVVKNNQNTITSVDFIEEEGAFMAGVTAAIVTNDLSLEGVNKEKIIGSVGGDKDPVIDAFIFGYKQGAEYIDEEIEVKNIYAGTWTDPVKGKQAANQLYSQGADIIFQIASLTGNGVLEAAAENNKYAIGVDSNQNAMEPGHVVTSDLKNVGDAIVRVYESIIDGSFEKGEVLEYGIKEGGVGLAIDEYTRDILSEDQIDMIQKISNLIAEGEIEVERYE
jgi:basic membrane protein A